MGRMWNEVRGALTAANLLLVAGLFVSQVPAAAYDLLQLESPPGFDLLAVIIMFYAVGYWLEVDSRKHSFRWPYCRGILLYATSFLIIPYYLFKTRGRYGCLTLFIFLCLMIMFSFIGMFVGTLLFGSRFE